MTCKCAICRKNELCLYISINLPAFSLKVLPCYKGCKLFQCFVLIEFCQSSFFSNFNTEHDLRPKSFLLFSSIFVFTEMMQVFLSNWTSYVCKFCGKYGFIGCVVLLLHCPFFEQCVCDGSLHLSMISFPQLFHYLFSCNPIGSLRANIYVQTASRKSLYIGQVGLKRGNISQFFVYARESTYSPHSSCPSLLNRYS